jgi:hypothetical protein
MRFTAESQRSPRSGKKNKTTDDTNITDKRGIVSLSVISVSSVVHFVLNAGSYVLAGYRPWWGAFGSAFGADSHFTAARAARASAVRTCG